MFEAVMLFKMKIFVLKKVCVSYKIDQKCFVKR